MLEEDVFAGPIDGDRRYFVVLKGSYHVPQGFAPVHQDIGVHHDEVLCFRG